MSTRNIIIGVLVLGGAYWYWKKYMNKANTNSVATQTNPILKPQKELAPKPQTSSPNVQPSVAPTEVVNSNIKNFLDFDGELEMSKN